MKLINKIITFIVIICSIGFIYGQDSGEDSRFIALEEFKYSGRTVDTDLIYNVSGSVRYLGFTKNDYITFPFEDAKNITSTGKLPDYQIYTYTSSSDIPFGSAMTPNFIYVCSFGYFFKFKYAASSIDDTQQITNGGVYAIVSDGVVSYGNQVFFLASEISTSTPVLLKYDEQDTFNNINDFTKLSIPLATDVYTIEIDTENGLIFIGGDEAKTIVYDISADTFYPFQQQGTSNQKLSAYTLDTTRKLLYSCITNTFTLSIQIVNYTDPKNIKYLTKKELFKGDLCTSGFVDTVGGQVFFIVSTNEGTDLVSFDTEGDAQEDLGSLGPINSGSPLRIVGNTNTLDLSLFFADSIISIEYNSICPSSCSGHGFCNYGVCECDYNYQGVGCENALCLNLNSCSGNGNCTNGECSCNSIWDGPNCTVRICQDNCNNRGFCNVTNNYSCQCNTGFEGQACETVSAPPECHLLDDSETCIERNDCGWCETDKVCAQGDKFGPYEGFCRTWFFDQNVEVGVIALAIIFICCIGILYLIDIGTTIPIDLKRAKDYQEEYKSGQHPKATHEEASVLWWRDQRSHKAWTLMDQFQFIALVSHIGVLFPSRFISFTEYLDWSNLGIPFPPSINPPQVWTADRDISRSTLSMAQYENSLGSGDLYLLPNILFWFGLLCGVFLVPLLVVLGVISLIERLVHWKEVVTNRIIHLSVRLLSFGYLGVLLAASFAMVTPLHDYRIIIPGAIIFVLYGIGLPIAIWFILNVPEARLHNPTFKQQFGCLYVHFKPKTDHRFVVFMFIKRFIMAVIVGILAFKPLAAQPLTGTDLAVPIVQVIVIDLALIGYAVLLFIRKPYFDHYQLWLEYLLTAINVITCSLSLTHIKSPSPAGELIACLIQAIALIACIASYVISWLQMRSKFLKKLQKTFSFCKCAKSDKTIEMNNKN